jgi:hypothetical protein
MLITESSAKNIDVNPSIYCIRFCNARLVGNQTSVENPLLELGKGIFYSQPIMNWTKSTESRIADFIKARLLLDFGDVLYEIELVRIQLNRLNKFSGFF